MEWISVKDQWPPVFKDTRKTFLAIWLDDGEIDGIEWYSFDGFNFWNLNSNNINHLGGKDGVKMFSHWALLPEPPKDQK